MEQRLSRGQNDSRRFRHRIFRELGLGHLQRPRWMVDLAANDSAVRISRVQAIAFGQEMLQRPGPWRKNLVDGAIPAYERSWWRSAMRPLALVVNPALMFFTGHSCTEVRQVKPGTSDGNSERVACIQAKKPDTGLATESHISTNIQFGERREPRQCRCPAQPHPGHAKWNHRDPRLPFKGVDRQLWGNQWAQDCSINRPVREEQVVPALGHHPRSGGKRPRPMRDFLEDGVHRRSQSFLDKLIF